MTETTNVKYGISSLTGMLLILLGQSMFAPHAVHAQNIKTLFSFNQNGQDGIQPWGGVTLSGNQLFGTTYYGGANGAGTVFSLNTDGSSFQTIVAFDQYRGASGYPLSGLTLVGSTMYGVTTGRAPGYSGGTNGSVYCVNTDGTGYTTLSGFNVTAGSEPQSRLAASDTQLFGTAMYGGASGYNKGTVFSINMNGSGLQNLHSFTDGPYSSSPTNLLLIGSRLYGTSGRGGTANSGTIFSLNTDGTDFRVLYSFDGAANGSIPWAGLTQCGGKLFGTTSGGSGTIYSINLDGTGFRTLYSFTGNTGACPGFEPASDLVLSGSKLYGTTTMGGKNNMGTVFSLNADGTGFQSLAAFDGNNGYTPTGNLVVNGSTLYGTTVSGNGNSGTVFCLAVPEPGSITLLVGCLLFGWMSWQRHSARRQ